ncbi:cupin domain-containing protein [Candidatus Nomurabacteria bacterium]|nr:cupin domain-containing protein [Candidatus Nomurabacteria bacterium]
MNRSQNGYADAIENETISNTDYRRVLYTGKFQLVLMSLKPGEEIGEEVHEDHDQFFRFEAGIGKVTINGEEISVIDGDAVVVPAGSKHNVINTSTEEELKLYTIYAPPQHSDGTVQHSKTEVE